MALLLPVKLEPGVYRYGFTASDSDYRGDAGSAGPTVMAIELPVLTGKRLADAGHAAGDIRLTYRQSQNLVPAIYVIVRMRRARWMPIRWRRRTPPIRTHGWRCVHTHASEPDRVDH